MNEVDTEKLAAATRALDAIAAEMAEARAEYEKLTTEGYVAWRRTQDMSDIFIRELDARYRAEHQEEWAALGRRVADIVMRACAAGGARFASISYSDLIVFENVCWPPRRDGMPRAFDCPLSRVVASKLGIEIGCANGPQTQVSLGMVWSGGSGTYDLRMPGAPVRIGPPLALLSMHFREVEKPFDAGSEHIHDYLRRCGVSI